MEIFRTYRHENLLLVYYREKDVFAFTLIPAEMEKEITARRTEIKDTLAARAICKALDFVFPTLEAESMVQFHLCGTPFCNDTGSSMRNTPCTKALKFLDQKAENDRIVTCFEYEKGLFFDHVAELVSGGVKIHTEVRNASGKSVRFDYLASFSLGMLSPFQREDGANEYAIHRVQSNWAAEGRHEILSAEAAGLEMSWQAAGVRSLRFGQTSTKPVRKYFPFAALEDKGNRVLWGAQLEALGAWELEIARFCDVCNLSGGQVDREFCNWSATLGDGESFSTMVANVTCARGDILDLFNALLKMQYAPAIRAAAERELPVLFNEFCTTWGDPREEKLLSQISAVKELGLKYFVLDDGWFQRNENFWQGDWMLDESKYPSSFDRFLDVIRSENMIPGIWFEMETVMTRSRVAKEHPEYLLTLDGNVICNGERLFLDLRREDARNFLRERVIAFLKRHRIGYVKIDYNSCISCGCDGDDTPQENQRRYTESVFSFYQEIRAALPELVIEVCASGGHRLTPGWIGFADMLSFSDAHECPQLPMIALDVQMLVPMKKSQIWAVLRKNDGSRRLHYSIAAGMMGRLCLSGEPAELTVDELAIVRDGVEFYREITPLLDRGSFRLEHVIGDYRSKPTGWQYLVRGDEAAKFVVFHTFGNPPDKVVIDLPENFKVKRTFVSNTLNWCFADGKLEISAPEAFEGAAFLLTKD